MFNTTHKERTEIRADWSDALITTMLDPTYCELQRAELVLWNEKDPEFLKKFRADCKEFLITIVEYRRIQAEKLYDHDAKHFSYLKKKKQYLEFAKYGGTECRLIYRTFFALKGYDSFKGWLDDDCLDRYSLEFIRKIYSEVGYYKLAA